MSNPGLVVILIDRSSSMDEEIYKNQSNSVSSDYLARTTVDTFVENMLRKSIRGSEFKEYFNLAVIEYSDTVDSAIENVSLDEFPISVQKLYDVSRKNNEVVSDILPIPKLRWIKSKSTYGDRTNSLKAFEHASMIIKKWIQNHMDSFPPVLIHISDENFYEHDKVSENGKIFSVCNDIKNSGTNDGNSLISNVIIDKNPMSTIEFPVLEEIQHDERLIGLASYSSFLDMKYFSHMFNLGFLEKSKSSDHRYLFFVNSDSFPSILALMSRNMAQGMEFHDPDFSEVAEDYSNSRKS